MVVKTITSKLDKTTGDIAVTFTVDCRTWFNMVRSAKDGSFCGTADYVAAQINTACMHDTPVADGTRMPERYGPSGLDDDIPF